MGKDLRTFLEQARKAGPEYFVEVKKPISVDLEVTTLQRKLAKAGRNPFIFCPQVKESKLRYCSNMFGRYELLGLALGLDPERLRSIGRREIQQEYMKRLKQPRPVEWVPANEAPVKEVIIKGDDVDLGVLPISKGSEFDSGKYISIGAMICLSPDTGIPNAGVYRHEVKGRRLLGAEISVMHNASYIARRYAELGKKMEVVIAIGHHPLWMFGVLTPGPVGMDELEIAGGFLQETLRVTKGETVDVPVPSDAEIAIEGWIDPSTMSTDGPFAEWAGYYGEGNKPCYIVNVNCITMRYDAIYHGLDSGHQEHNIAGVLALEGHIYNAVKARVDTVKAVHCPPSGCCNLHYYISIAKRVQGEGQVAGLLALAAGENHAKAVVVVDEDVDVFSEEEVLWAIATRVSWDRNVTIIPRVAQWPTDPSTYSEQGYAYNQKVSKGGLVGKVIIDATKPVSGSFARKITTPADLWDSIKLEEYF